MRPFTTFNFHVSFTLPGKKNEVCEAEFSECSGLEMSMELKTIKEGGNNGEQIHLAGPMTYGQLSLKRGMTKNFDLWDWFESVQNQRNLRVDGEVQILSSLRTSRDQNPPGKKNKDVVFKLSNCVPMKMVAPSLNAKDGEIAIEEIQIAYERLYRVTDSSSQGGDAQNA
jgi:phage tail-like protein